MPEDTKDLGLSPEALENTTMINGIIQTLFQDRPDLIPLIPSNQIKDITEIGAIIIEPLIPSSSYNVASHLIIQMLAKKHNMTDIVSPLLAAEAYEVFLNKQCSSLKETLSSQNYQTFRDLLAQPNLTADNITTILEKMGCWQRSDQDDNFFQAIGNSVGAITALRTFHALILFTHCI